MPKLSIVKVKLDREVNSYIVSCATTKEAVVIDPGLPAEKIVEQAAGLTIKYILATHGHPGHVAGKDDVKTATGGETGIHSADAKQFLRSADRICSTAMSSSLASSRSRSCTHLAIRRGACASS